MVAEALKLTVRLLLATRGAPAVRALLAGFFAATPPSLFAAEEGERFAAWLAGRGALDAPGVPGVPGVPGDLDVPGDPGVPYLTPVLAYERALLATLHDGRPRVVPFPFDPLPVLRALAEGRLPDPALVGAGRFEIEVTPPAPEAAAGGDDAGLRALAAPQVLHR